MGRKGRTTGNGSEGGTEKGFGMRGRTMGKGSGEEVERRGVAKVGDWVVKELGYKIVTCASCHHLTN